MHPRTAATLEELTKATWFSKVGEPDPDVIVVSSWSEAIAHCSSLEWENLSLEAANQYCMRVLQRSKERYALWNEIADQIRPVAIALVREKIRVVVERHALPTVFEETVQWDIVHLCMEAEYADVYPPGFFASQAYWYVAGRFPCGWQGKFPAGRLIVY